MRIPDAPESSSKTPSAAEIGTATHTFLEFCDYGRLVLEGVDAECSRLLAEGFGQHLRRL